MYLSGAVIYIDRNESHVGELHETVYTKFSKCGSWTGRLSD